MGKRYRSDMLNKVIIRIDFTSSLTQCVDDIPKGIRDIVLRTFPIPEVKEEILNEVVLNELGIQETKIIKQKSFYFHSLDRKKNIMINKNALFIEYNKYNGFEFLKTDFKNCLDSFQIQIPECKVNRLGLRYINKIIKDGINFFEWEDLITTDLIQTQKLSVEGGKIVRDFHNSIFKFDDDSLLIMQYGSYNQDFPAEIHKNEYILDFDISKRGSFDIATVLSFLDVFHTRIENLFESSITQGMREKLGVINE